MGIEELNPWLQDPATGYVGHLDHNALPSLGPEIVGACLTVKFYRRKLGLA
ncbi:hypothetical protein ACFL5Z_11315 [Planctomycetota bacterium]